MAYEDHSPSVSGEGRPVLLLHGLAGHRGEWADLLGLLLPDGHRVITYDARGHGESTRAPRDMTRAVNVRDAVALIRGLDLAPVTLVGQSLGGLTALLTAAAHPELVRSLVLVEAGPDGPSPNLPSEIAGWLDSWPTPFESPSAGAEFFGHEAWGRGLERRADGWYPRVAKQSMLAAVEELAVHDYWGEWSRVSCPPLVVRGGSGTMREREQTEMRERRPGTETVTVPGAGHDVHLDQPGRLYDEMKAFLACR
ncbi:alpha/beta fold hydrolase [Streptomyces sp. NBC_00576]|uniref:alpha/beta fold hydrolase n=1 Tax=Streptomyces sp. NBC_00576 TaxID=2903665 RepID=UPI002E804D0F|nr:alpha/beta hydrolase [Streptomyces sp. NBC_00576]WUB74092.1 alpha/beta hydrolase [Streptomyces sp. NBC_00576]